MKTETTYAILATLEIGMTFLYNGIEYTVLQKISETDVKVESAKSVKTLDLLTIVNNPLQDGKTPTRLFHQNPRAVVNQRDFTTTIN